MKLITHIQYLDQQIANLKMERDRLFALEKKHPNATIDNGTIALANIWDKITCMTIRHKYRNRMDKVVIRLFTGTRNLIDGKRVYASPLDAIVAEISYSYTNYYIGQGQRQQPKGTIRIYDYASLIDDSCPRKTNFVRRIKLHLARTIKNSRLTIDPQSFDIGGMEKLLLL